jgi:hypothetical protein
MGTSIAPLLQSFTFIDWHGRAAFYGGSSRSILAEHGQEISQDGVGLGVQFSIIFLIQVLWRRKTTKIFISRQT